MPSTSSTFLGLTPSELRASFSQLREMIAQGLDEREMLIEIGVTFEEYEELLRRFFEHELQVERKRTSDDAYLNYLLEQRANMRALTGMIRKFGESKQYNAMVGAIRAKSEISEKILDRGIQFGFLNIKTAPKTINGVLVTEAASTDIRKTIFAIIGDVRRLSAGQSTVSMDSLEVGEIHGDDVVVDVQAEPTPEKPKVSRAKAKRAARRGSPADLDSEPPI